MDKIDIVIFRYKSERKLSIEFMVKVCLMAIPMLLVMSADIIVLVVAPVEYKLLATLLCLVIINILIKVNEGKLGTRKWKKELIKMYHKNFLSDQNKLLEIISDEGLNNQQVYNSIVKKYKRMPQNVSKENFTITIISLIVAMTGVLVSPLQNTNMENYVSYLANVIAILIYLLPIGYMLYRYIFSGIKQRDKKRGGYEYLMKLLEDVIY